MLYSCIYTSEYYSKDLMKLWGSLTHKGIGKCIEVRLILLRILIAHRRLKIKKDNNVMQIKFIK